MPTTSVSAATSASRSRDEADVRRRDAHLAVRGDVVVAVAVVDLRLEDLDLLPRNLRAAQPADELFALPAEHAAGDDFNPPGPGRGVLNIHCDCRLTIADCGLSIADWGLGIDEAIGMRLPGIDG